MKILNKRISQRLLPEKIALQIRYYPEPPASQLKEIYMRTTYKNNTLQIKIEEQIRSGAGLSVFLNLQKNQDH